MKKLFFATFVALSATAVIAFSAVSCKEHCEVDGVAVFELSQSEFQVANSGETVSVKVASKVNWTAESTEDWIRLKAEDIKSVDSRDSDNDFAATITAPFNSDRAGGYVTVEIEVAKNEVFESRTGAVVFTTADKKYILLLITQDGDPTAMPSDMELAFPDPIFRAYVMDKFDTDKDGKISKEEAEKVKRIYVDKDYSTPDDERIASLEGIQYFTNLTHLDCYCNNLTELDVTHNTALTYLDCHANQLKTLDVTQNPALIELACGENQLTELDVTHNPALRDLYCGDNQLTKLDVTQNPALTELICFENQLTELVTHNPALTDLNCGGNQLTELDVTQNTALTRLWCGSNQLTKLDVTQNPALIEFACSSNQLTTLNVSECSALGYVECNDNQLTELDVTQNTALTSLYCINNQLTELDVTQNTALTFLDCSSNQLTTLDVSKTNLGNSRRTNPLICINNPLTVIYLKEGWTINGIYPVKQNSYVPANTQILFKD